MIVDSFRQLIISHLWKNRRIVLYSSHISFEVDYKLYTNITLQMHILLQVFQKFLASNAKLTQQMMKIEEKIKNLLSG